MAAEASERPLPRAFWSGTLSFGLVSIPVDLYAAIRPRRISMRMLSPEGHLLSRRYVCSQDGRPLDSEEIVRGYPLPEGGFVVVSDEELDDLEPKKSRDIDLRRFVSREQIEPMLLNRPYILAPAGQSTKAYHLLAAAMERSGHAGIASFVMRGTEYLVAIFAEGGLLRAETLRYSEELRRPSDVGLPEVQRAPADRRRQMEEAMTTLERETLDESFLRDESGAELLALAERKRAESRDIVEVPEVGEEAAEGSDNVIDIMSLLKERIGMVAKADTNKSEKAAPASRTGGEDLSRRSKQELYERAKELDIPGRSRMSKEELVDALHAASSAPGHAHGSA